MTTNRAAHEIRARLARQLQAQIDEVSAIKGETAKDLRARAVLKHLERALEDLMAAVNPEPTP